MGPRAVQLSARTLCRRFPSLYQSSVLLLRPLSRPQSSPPNATHCSHRLASTSSVSAPTSAFAIGQQPLPMGSQLKSSLGRFYVIDEVLSERPAAGRIWCVYRATSVDPFLAICPVYGQRTENLTTSQFQTRGEAVCSQGHHSGRLRLRYFAAEARRALSPCLNSCG